MSWFTKEIVLVEPGITERERKQALAVTRDHPMFQAVLSLLADHISDAIELVAAMQTSTNPQHVTHAAGQLDGLRGFRDDLEALRAEAETGSE